MKKANRVQASYFYIFVTDDIVLNVDVPYVSEGTSCVLKKGHKIPNDEIRSINNEEPIAVNCNTKRVLISPSNCILIRAGYKKQRIGIVHLEPIWIQVPVNILTKLGGEKTYPRVRGWRLE